MNVTSLPGSAMHEHRVYNGGETSSATTPTPLPELTEQQKKVLEKARAGMTAKIQAAKESGAGPQDTLFLKPQKGQVDLVSRYHEAAQKSPSNTVAMKTGETISVSGKEKKSSAVYDENGYAVPTDEYQKIADSFEQSRNPQTASQAAREKWRQETTLMLGGEWNRMDDSNIPKENFLDEGVEQYKKAYNALDKMYYANDQEEALRKSELDKDFADYVQTGFEKAGLSEEDAAFVADTFSREFRMGMIGGKGFEQSQLEALRKLNEVSPSLISQIQYSGYSFDFGV